MAASLQASQGVRAAEINSLMQRRPVKNEVVNPDLNRTTVEDGLLAASQDDPLEQTPKQFPFPACRFLCKLCENQ